MSEQSCPSTGRTEAAPAAESDPSSFIVKLGDKLAVTPCLEFVLYLDVTDDRAILDFYERCREALGGLLTHFQAESMNSFRKLNARGNSLVPTWFTQPRRGKIDYHMEFGGCDLNDEASPTGLLMRVMRRTDAEKELARLRSLQGSGRRLPHYPTSDLRLTLPLDHPLARPEKFRDWVLEFDLLKVATGFSGFAGYALNHADSVEDSTLRAAAEQSLASLCGRHPGFGMLGGAVQSKIFRYRPDRGDILPRIKRANWLTLLCDRTVEAAGGAESLRAALGSDHQIQTVRLPHGLWVQAGPAPLLGDLAEGNLIPSYRCVAKALRSVRVEQISSVGEWFPVKAANDWLNAFEVEDVDWSDAVLPPLGAREAHPPARAPQGSTEPIVEFQVWDLPQQFLTIDVRGADVGHFGAQRVASDDDNIPDPIDAFVTAARLGMFTPSAVPPWDSSAMVVARDTAAKDNAAQYRVEISNLDRGALRVLTNLLRARDLDAVTVYSAAPTSTAAREISLAEPYPRHFEPVDFRVDYEIPDHSQRERMVQLTFVSPPSAVQAEAAYAGFAAWTILLMLGGYPRDDKPPAQSGAAPDTPFLFDDHTIEQAFPDLFLCDEACFDALVNWVQSFNRSVAAIDKLTIR